MVEGQSMEPNLYNGEVFVIDRLVDRNGDLKRGEIVVFSFDGEYFYVKRVIGLPGETVRIGKEKIEIKNENADFKTLNEVYLLGGKYDYGDQRYFLVPEGEYFVLGDNRDNSKDSRTFSYPFVEVEKIYGRYMYP